MRRSRVGAAPGRGNARVSIHSPARRPVRRELPGEALRPTSERFNPLTGPKAGETPDPNTGLLIAIVVPVSIHSPARRPVRHATSDHWTLSVSTSRVSIHSPARRPVRRASCLTVYGAVLQSFNPLTGPKAGETTTGRNQVEQIGSFNPLTGPKAGETTSTGSAIASARSRFNPLTGPKAGETATSAPSRNLERPSVADPARLPLCSFQRAARPTEPTPSREPHARSVIARGSRAKRHSCPSPGAGYRWRSSARLKPALPGVPSPSRPKRKRVRLLHNLSVDRARETPEILYQAQACAPRYGRSRRRRGAKGRRASGR